MSLATAREAVIAAVQSVTPYTDLMTRFHVVRSGPPLEKRCDDLRAFELRNEVGGVDAGIAGAGITMRAATWSVCVLYPAPPTHDSERLRMVMQQDADLISDALILPSAWFPHLDVCEPQTPADPSVVTGTDGAVVAYVTRIPFIVHYRS